MRFTTKAAHGRAIGTRFCVLSGVLVGLAGGAAGQNGVIAVGPGAGEPPEVRFYDPLTGTLTDSFFAFDPLDTFGVTVALGDVNADGTADLIAGAGPNGLSRVRVFDGVTHAMITEFYPFGSRFSGGIEVASGDVNGDGFDDVITAPASSSDPLVRVFDPTSGYLELYTINAHPVSFQHGIHVGAGDINGDGIDDVITGKAEGDDAHIRVWNGPDGSFIDATISFGSTVHAGVFVAGGDTDNDGIDEVVAGADGPVPSLTLVHDTTNLFTLTMLFGFSEPNFGGGVRTASGDVNGDGYEDIVVGAGPWTNTVIGPLVNVYSGDGYALLSGFTAGNPLSPSGIYVAGPWNPDSPPCVADVNGDGVLTPADFNAWILAFNTMAPGCDQNGDSVCNPADFNAFILNFNTGCS